MRCLVVAATKGFGLAVLLWMVVLWLVLALCWLNRSELDVRLRSAEEAQMVRNALAVDEEVCHYC